MRGFGIECVYVAMETQTTVQDSQWLFEGDEILTILYSKSADRMTYLEPSTTSVVRT